MSVRNLRRLLKEAGIDLHKIGSRIKVKESDLLTLIDSGTEFSDMDQYL